MTIVAAPDDYAYEQLSLKQVRQVFDRLSTDDRAEIVQTIAHMPAVTTFLNDLVGNSHKALQDLLPQGREKKMVTYAKLQDYLRHKKVRKGTLQSNGYKDKTELAEHLLSSWRKKEADHYEKLPEQEKLVLNAIATAIIESCSFGEHFSEFLSGMAKRMNVPAGESEMSITFPEYDKEGRQVFENADVRHDWDAKMSWRKSVLDYPGFAETAKSTIIEGLQKMESALEQKEQEAVVAR